MWLGKNALVRTLGAAALMIALASNGPANAQTVEQFYKGKTIRIVCALGTGGDYDAYARLVGRWLGKYIPGSPSIVVENMPGAGGIIAANHLFNVAPKDGTVIGALHQNTALAQVTGTANVEYDTRKLNWIGRIATGGTDVHHTYNSATITSFEDLFKDKEVVAGGGGPTSSSVVLPTTLRNLMGAKIKILAGYKGTAETDLALERGEIDLALQNWENLRRSREEAIRDGKIKLIVQYGFERHPELPNVRTVMELSKTDEQKQVWTLLLRPSTIGYSSSMAAGVPADRIDAIRKAFDAMVKDPGLAEDVVKAKLVMEPVTGQTLASYVDGMFKTDPSAVAKVKDLLQPK